MMLEKTQEEDLPAALENETDPDDFGSIPFDDDDSEDQAGPTMMNTTTNTNDNDDPQQDSMLQLSAHDFHSTTGVGLDVSGLDESREEEEASRKRPASPDPPAERTKRKRKRRKVVVDNDETELGNDHIKKMIAETEGLVRRQVHPAADDDGDLTLTGDNPAKLSQSQSQIHFCRPFLADDGQLHSSLEQLWTQNYYRALDLPCGFDKLQTPEAVEAVREADDGDDASRSDMEDSNSQIPTTTAAAPLDDDDEEEDEPVDFAVPMDDDDDEEEDQQLLPNIEDSDEYDEEVAHERQGTYASIHSFDHMFVRCW
jgi:hypothetical protein